MPKLPYFNLFELTDKQLLNPIELYPPRSKNLRPSEASIINRVTGEPSGKCARAVYYRLMDAPITDPPLPKMYYTWMMGKLFEDRLVEEWKKMGLYVANSVRFYNGRYHLSGELDCVIKHPDIPDQLIGLEVKTGYGYNYEKQVIGTINTMGQPKIENLLQASIYLNEFKHSIAMFKIPCMTRDSMKRAEFDIELIDGGKRVTVNGKVQHAFLIEDIYNRFDYMWEHYEKQIIPQRDYMLKWDDETIERKYDSGDLSESAYKKFKGARRPDTREKYRPGDWQCFAPRTLVWMSNGEMKTIKDIKVGDEVVSIDGPTKVVKVGSKTTNSKMVTVKPAGTLGVDCTEDHKWLIGSWDNWDEFCRMETINPKLMQAKDIIAFDGKENIDRVDVVFIPVIDFSYESDLTIELCEFLGYYAALGDLEDLKYDRVTFVLDSDNMAVVDKIVELGINLSDKNSCNIALTHDVDGKEILKIIFRSKKLLNYVRKNIIGDNNENKTLSHNIMGLDHWSTDVFLSAVAAGHQNIVKVASKILSLQYQQLFWKVDVPVVVKHIDGIGYSIQFTVLESVKLVRVFNKKFAALRIEDVISTEKTDKVYDIEVDSTHHVFATSGGLASNCSYCQYKTYCWSSDK